MPPSHTLLLAYDNKNTVLAEMAGSTHHFAYTPYGQQSSLQEVMTRLGFNGEPREAKTDWYFLGNGYRVYNPRLMRFHSPDSMSPFRKGGLNAYGYCEGEPVSSFDPTGHFSWKLFGRTVLKRVQKTASTVFDFFSDNPSAGLNVDLDLPRPITSSGRGGLWDVGASIAADNKNPGPPRQPLGTSRTKKQGSPTGATPSRTASTSAQPSRESSSVRTGVVLEGNYGVRPQNEHSTVKTRDGARISGTDSGVKQFPSTSTGVRQPWREKR